jgi:CRISPR-associated protein Cmr2
MNEPWETLLLAWLHDPVDKAADIRGHFSRAKRYAAEILDRDVTDAELKGGLADQLASAYERLPMPDARDRYEQLGVGPVDGRLTIFHPLSAEQREIEIDLAEREVAKVLRQVGAPELPLKTRFLSLWRLAPERLAERWPGLRMQPAETRCPDHTLWHHLDSTAAMAWALRGGGGPALLSFKIGPVQPFIEAARSMRDLLTGSYLLSALMFAAIEPVLAACGPTALVYPALRGVPLMDDWLRRQGVPVKAPDLQALSRPSIPHRFLALVPHALADTLMTETRRAAEAKWFEIADAVHSDLKSQLDQDWPNWDRLWKLQIESYFDFRTASFRTADTDHRELLGHEKVNRFTPIKSLGHYSDVQPGTWQNSVEISAMLMDAATRIRRIPDYRPSGQVPQKCTLLGTYEQMGPAKLSESRRFFEDGLRFEKGTDRLCAISLTKRFAFQRYFKQRLGIDPEDYQFPDTDNLCKRSGDGCQYYALLAMDGDDMGKWLSGMKSPRIKEVLHPRIAAWQERNGDGSKALDLPRPVSPALHASISEALNRFATAMVPSIVNNHNGVVIYAGGDDVLAALPVATALPCALALRNAFASFEALGSRATMSAGLVLAHKMENLRHVIGSTRQAEKHSKAHDGKDRLTLAVMRRSGEHAFASCRWDYTPTVIDECETFRGGCSDRWTYQLRQQMPVLKALPRDAFRTELRRLLARSEKRDSRFLDDFSRFVGLHDPPVCEDFVTLCQSASFITRGRD